eukprot:522564-Prorocentrum_minimum.AAC.1
MDIGLHRAVNLRVIGASRVDLATQGRFIPGSVSTSQLLETGWGGQIVLGGLLALSRKVDSRCTDHPQVYRPMGTSIHDLRWLQCCEALLRVFRILWLSA